MPGKPVIGHVDPYNLNKNVKPAASEAVNIIKDKRDGRIKGLT